MKTLKINNLQKVLSTYGHELNALGLAVHEEVLYGYLDKHSKAVLATVQAIAEVTDGEIHRGALTGILSESIPRLALCKDLEEFDAEEAQSIAAALIIQILRNNKAFIFKTKGKMITKPNGRRIEVPQHVVVFKGLKKPSDVLRGVEIMPGMIKNKKVAGRDMAKLLKTCAKYISSVPFKVSDVVTDELLQKGYSLTQDYNTPSKNESLHKKQRTRYPLYKKTILEELINYDQFFATAQFDERLRQYYNFGIPGCNFQGKAWETYTIDSAQSYHINDRGVEHIKHIIYVLRHGRSTMLEALAKYDKSDTVWAGKQDPLGNDLVFKDGCGEAISEFGDRILANKCHIALAQHEAGMPTHYLFGKDMTNLGCGVAGASFKSPNMMHMGNVGGDSNVVDSHTEYTDNFGVSYLARSIVKKIGQETLHGSTAKSVLSHINRLLPEGSVPITMEQLRAVNMKTFGPCLDNIDAVAEFGCDVVDNYQTRLNWKTPDGLIASHSAKMKHVPFKVRALSADESRGYVEDTIVRTMPLSLNSAGYPAFKSGYGAGVYSKDGVVIKVRGLYANITHSLDAYFLRKLCVYCGERNIPFFFKHDNYFMPANELDCVITLGQDFFSELHRNNYYEHALAQIHVNTNKRMMGIPKLVVGDAVDTSSESVNFLMP